MKDSICIIPARGGSRRIPRKNRRVFHGKPIFQYSVETAWASELFERVVVSTDDDDLAGLAYAMGADVHERRPEHAQDHIGTQEVTAQVLEDLGWDGECACCLYATAPLVVPFDLSQARLILGDDPWINYVVTSCANRIEDAGAFYFGRTAAFKARWPLASPETVLWPLPPERCCDINEEHDWLKAELLYEAMRANP